MDEDSSQPGTPAGGPLQAITQDRVNQQRDSISSVHDKISQFNSMGIVMQSKQLERRTADAALKRAMLGREEAEAELRKLREETRSLHKAVEEGKERERRVGERLETVMENYGRAKETHAHTQTLWEKEIRRARKETFKTQSMNVKLHEELKTARTAVKILEDGLKHEKERSRAREQEAFEARYQIVGVQEQLDQALARIKVVEQERDAFKTAAKNEEVARIAAEGRIPLPRTDDPTDEFASPPKKAQQQKKRKISGKEPRYSLSAMEIEASVATEMEIEQLTSQVQWERQRADRAQDMVEFLQAECEMRCCPCGRARPQPSPRASRRQSRHSSIPPTVPTVEEVAEEVAGQDLEKSVRGPKVEEPRETPLEAMDDAPPITQSQMERGLVAELAPRKTRKSRRSTIFCPKEGIFRTVSEQEAEALEAQQEAEVVVPDASPLEEEGGEEHEEDKEEDPTTAGPMDYQAAEPEAEPEAVPDARMYARTPSVEPPTFAISRHEQRTSLMSLLSAPHNEAHEPPTPSIPMVPDLPPAADEDRYSEQTDDHARACEQRREQTMDEDPVTSRESLEPRPHTSTATYATVTTRIPVQDEGTMASSTSSIGRKLHTPTSGNKASFDTTNPALTPTMTREQALAKIRERRGRARSVENGKATPHKKMLQGKERRDMSAPTAKAGGRSR